MKFLIVFTCALAAVSAGYVAPATFYAGAQHFPVINHEGVPTDTASVQQAKATHFAHKVNVEARNRDLAVAPIVAHPQLVHPGVAPVVAHPAVVAHPGHAYPTTAVAPVSVNGVPLETPEVAAAKAQHFAAHAEALARYRRGVFGAGVVAYGAYPYSHSYGFPYGYNQHY